MHVFVLSPCMVSTPCTYSLGAFVDDSVHCYTSAVASNSIVCISVCYICSQPTLCCVAILRLDFVYWDTVFPGWWWQVQYSFGVYYVLEDVV